MLMRTMNLIELRGVIKGSIPIVDKFGTYNCHGLAVVKRNGKFGVVNTEPNLVIPIEYDQVFLLDNSLVIVLKSGQYSICDQIGTKLTNRCFSSMVDAFGYAKYF